jgi:hypothetical protein
MRTIIELNIAVPAARVWTALREPLEIRRWFGWEHAGLGEEIAFIFGADCQVLDEGRSLKISGVDTTFSLDGDEFHTSLRVTTPSAAGEVEHAYDEVEEGWISFVQQLRFALERQPGIDRRTLFLPSPPRTPIERTRAQRGRPPFGSFARLSEMAPGSRYSLTAAEPLEGEVWFSTEHQLGVTTHEGNGLLILSRQPNQALNTAILSTFNLGDEALQALRERWLPWWKIESA